MRYLLGFVLVLSSVPSSSSVSAQGTDEGWVDEFYPELAPREPASETTPDKPPAKPAPGARPVEAPPDQPTLLLEADDAGVEVAPTPREARKPGSFSSELRFELAAYAFRWSSYVPERSGLPDYGKRSLHFVFGLGVRFYPKSPHGVLLDLQYLLDADADSPPGPGWFCLVDCPPDLRLQTHFTLVHVGYAYRHVVTGPRDPGRLAWAFTPHASLSAGLSDTEPGIDTSPEFNVTSSSSPVVGARFGIDVDLHIKRFFMGWTLRYEVLKHTKGPLRATQLLSFNIVPVFHLGAVLGAKVQEN